MDVTQPCGRHAWVSCPFKAEWEASATFPCRPAAHLACHSSANGHQGCVHGEAIVRRASPPTVFKSWVSFALTSPRQTYSVIECAWACSPSFCQRGSSITQHHVLFFDNVIESNVCWHTAGFFPEWIIRHFENSHGCGRRMHVE